MPSIVARVGDDVRRRAGVELADGDDRRLGRVHLAADELLEAHHRLARGDDRVAAEVRERAVAAAADERGGERVRRREQRARLGRDGADRQPRPAVQPEDRVDLRPEPPVEHARLDEPLRPAAALLGRLPDELHADGQLVARSTSAPTRRRAASRCARRARRRASGRRACWRRAARSARAIGSASMSARSATQGLDVSPIHAIVAVGASGTPSTCAMPERVELRADQSRRS